MTCESMVAVSVIALDMSALRLEKGAIISSNCPFSSMVANLGMKKYETMELIMFQQALRNDNTRKMVMPVGRFLGVCALVSIFRRGEPMCSPCYYFIFRLKGGHISPPLQGLFVF